VKGEFGEINVIQWRIDLKETFIWSWSFIGNQQRSTYVFPFLCIIDSSDFVGSRRIINCEL